MSALDGTPLGNIYLTINTTPAAELMLTFTCALGENGPLDTGPEAHAAALQTFNLGTDTCSRWSASLSRKGIQQSTFYRLLTRMATSRSPLSGERVPIDHCRAQMSS